MSLWTLIRDFFVSHFFGGYTSDGTSYIMPIGQYFNTQQVIVYKDLSGNVSLSLGEWLSTTFTIITLVLIVFFLYLSVKWIFKLFSGLLK